MTSINTINSTAAASTTSAPNAFNQLSQNYSTFLTLLTTQLKNQDPTSPMDSSQFTNQLVMYSQVEQQIDTNSKLDSLVSAINTTQGASALSYLGMAVDAPGTTFSYDGSSPVTLGYQLADTASSANVSIVDSNGNVVWSGTGSGTAGSNTFSWDGTDSSGNKVAAGSYGIVASATDSSGNAVDTTTLVPGTVDGVETDGGTVYLTVNGQRIAENNVTTAQKATQ